MSTAEHSGEGLTEALLPLSSELRNDATESLSHNENFQVDGSVSAVEARSQDSNLKKLDNNAASPYTSAVDNVDIYRQQPYGYNMMVAPTNQNDRMQTRSGKKDLKLGLAFASALMLLTHAGFWIASVIEMSRLAALNVNGNYYEQPNEPDLYCSAPVDDANGGGSELNDLLTRVLMLGAFAVYHIMQLTEFYFTIKSIRTKESPKYTTTKLATEFIFKSPLDAQRIGRIKRRWILFVRFCVGGFIVPITAFRYSGECIHSVTYLDEYSLVVAYKTSTLMIGAAIFTFALHIAACRIICCCERSLFLTLTFFFGGIGILIAFGLGIIIATSDAAKELVNILDLTIFAIDLTVMIFYDTFKVKLYPGLE